jgi:hypothetical protein
MTWINYIVNRQSFDSLYSTPPSFKDVHVLKIEKFLSNCHVDFILHQLPDITPQKGIWASTIKARNVYVSISFDSFCITSPCPLALPGKYDIDIRSNPDYVETIIYKNNLPYLDSSEKIIIQIKNELSSFSFTAYDGRVLRLTPMNTIPTHYRNIH